MLRVGMGRLGRGGAWAGAVIGMVTLTFCELLAMRYADWHSETANAGLMDTSYGISVIVIGLGVLAGGVGVLRARAPGVDDGSGRPWPSGLPPSRW